MLDRFHIVASSAQPLDPASIRHVADAVGISTYDARLRLRSTVPRPVAFRNHANDAFALARRIQSPQIKTIVYCESSFPAVAPFSAFRLGRTSDGFIFENRQGTRRTLRIADMELVVFGRKMFVKTESRLEYSEVNPMHERTRLSPGVNVVNTRRKNWSTFVTFFPCNPKAPPIRIVAEEFEFQCLGRAIGMSDLVSGQRLVRWIDDVIQGVPADRRLMETSVVESTIPHKHANSPDPEHAVSVILHLEHHAAQVGAGFLDATQ